MLEGLLLCEGGLARAAFEQHGPDASLAGLGLTKDELLACSFPTIKYFARGKPVNKESVAE